MWVLVKSLGFCTGSRNWRRSFFFRYLFFCVAMLWYPVVFAFLHPCMTRLSVEHVTPSSSLVIYKTCTFDDECRVLESCSCFVAAWRVCCVFPETARHAGEGGGVA